MAPVRMGTAQGRWVLGATIGGSGMAMLDGTVVNVALARIGVEFDAGFTALQWIVNSYTLTLAALILLEHQWAVPLRDAVAEANGFRISDGFISPLDLVGIGLLADEEAKEQHLLETASASTR